MKAVLAKRHGPPESLVFEEVASPVPGPGEVLVSVHASAVNFPDTLIIENKYQFKPALPFSPGGEVAGTVKAVGPGVEGFAPGDRVIAVCGWGGYAEEVLTDARKLVRLPAGIAMEAAAALVITYGTSHYALKERADIRPGETLLVLGAAGGTGISAIELGKLMGARVIAAASSDEKLALCRQAGADETINYASEDLRERLKALTGGRGVDVVYDPVGGQYTEPALRSMAWKGRYLVIGFTTGEIPRPPLNLALLKGCAIVGVFYGGFAQAEPKRYDELMQELLGWLAKGRIRPVITGRYPLERAAEALRLVADRRATGKIMLTTALGRASSPA
ncbi:NADPH:quinone oxidoreductase family protein [Variovorax saccharolyticus]|uniref:NADPH:quinone oxidoreductase family protein n=1 Tax=Variovorax saccharolyticus TaxID=3053516 RepID=UPI0025782799|nr:NADPH:quinone oxidoreductase family protein [Variovorax sp. J31P216]MDM0024572.1 NADPH:quinone oxidoreductase family protein [Variovorax sp. J31P216]